MEILIFTFSFMITYILSKFFAENIANFSFYRIFARERSQFHKNNKEILKIGGIIIFVSTILAISIISLFKKDLEIPIYDLKKIAGLTTGMIIILMLGIYDDAKKIGYRGKFLWQIVATIPIMISGYNISRLSFFGGSLEIYWFGYLLMVFWIILITNAINLIDGLDGLASGIAIITFSALAIISHRSYPAIEILCLAYIGSLLAFLKYNFYPARLYLGDSGSLLLGFVLAVISLEINVKMNTLTALSLPVLILMLPIGSAVYSFSRRIRKGKNPFVADRLHLHYLLLGSGLPHHIVVVLFWISSMVLTMLGVISYFSNRRLEFFILAAGVIVLIISYVSGIVVISKRKT